MLPDSFMIRKKYFVCLIQFSGYNICFSSRGKHVEAKTSEELRKLHFKKLSSATGESTENGSSLKKKMKRGGYV